MTICRDCAHIRLSDVAPQVAEIATCSVSVRTSPVDGREEPMYCIAARTAGGPCGPEARLFEAKES